MRHRAIALALSLASARCQREAPLQPAAPARVADASAARDAALDAATDASERTALLLPPMPSGAVQNTAIFTAALGDRAMREPPAATPASARSGRAPTIAAVESLLIERRSSTAQFVAEGPFSPLGDGRFALLVRRTDLRYPSSPSFELHVVSESPARAAQLEGSAQIPTSYLFAGESGRNGCEPAVLSREVRDIDNDREPELSLALRYCLRAPCGGGGYHAMEYQAVYDLTPAPRLALLVERRVRGQRSFGSARTRTVTWRDVNHDGHADAVVEGRDCAPDPQRTQAFLSDHPPETNVCARPELECADNPSNLRNCTNRSETVLYDSATDVWRAGTDGAEPLTDLPCEE